MGRTSLIKTIKEGLKLWKIYAKALDIYDKSGGKKMLKYLLNRLGEASTWRGLFLFFTAIGVKLAPELQELILAAGLALVGFIGFFFKDKKEVK